MLLAKDLGAAGVDIDYEEMWHADTFKYGTAPGPFTNPQVIAEVVCLWKWRILTAISCFNVSSSIKCSVVCH